MGIEAWRIGVAAASPAPEVMLSAQPLSQGTTFQPDDATGRGIESYVHRRYARWVAGNARVAIAQRLLGNWDQIHRKAGAAADATADLELGQRLRKEADDVHRCFKLWANDPYRDLWNGLDDAWIELDETWEGVEASLGDTGRQACLELFRCVARFTAASDRSRKEQLAQGQEDETGLAQLRAQTFRFGVRSTGI